MRGDRKLQAEIARMMAEAARIEPNIRFCQHIMNALQMAQDPYFVEDEALHDALRKYVLSLKDHKIKSIFAGETNP